jgi:hypothetical protein
LGIATPDAGALVSGPFFFRFISMKARRATIAIAIIAIAA